jgi:hypothetical protein
VEITKEDGAVTTLSVERDIERERGKECVCVCERERERERERDNGKLPPPKGFKFE